MSAHDSFRVAGLVISPGLVIGQAFVYRSSLHALAAPYAIRLHQVEEEFTRIDSALDAVRQDLHVSAKRIEADTGPKLAAIFEAHEMMLRDRSLRLEIRGEIEEQLIGAAQAIVRVFTRWEGKFRAMTQELHRERADDLLDLQGRLLREIAGVRTTGLEKMPRGRVLVAHRLLPSDTIALPRRAVTGIVLEFAGLGSHAALLARALGIPTVAQVENATRVIADAQELIVDGIVGEVVVDPDAETRARYEEDIRRFQHTALRARRLARQPAHTLDGTYVAVMANVGCPEDVVAAVENGADGVGLYRMEQYYLGRNTPPSASELLTAFAETFAPIAGKPITVRLLDLGADKPLSFLKFPIEDDPFLGRRGVRLLLRYPDLMETQLRAIVELARDHDVRILVPMVTLAEEMARVREHLHAVASTVVGATCPPLGAMIETPAAALTLSAIIRYSDFFSIGTNDLTQYTMAAGRENGLVSEYFLENHPAVMRLVRLVVVEAGQTPVSVCGEIAAQIDSIPTLLELGVRSLSVAPTFVPAVKQVIRETSLQAASVSSEPTMIASVGQLRAPMLVEPAQ